MMTYELGALGLNNILSRRLLTCNAFFNALTVTEGWGFIMIVSGLL